MATAQEIAAMTDMEDAVLRGLEAAEAEASKVYWPAEAWERAGAVVSPLAWLFSSDAVSSVLRTDAQEAVLANLRTLRTRVDTWSGTSTGGLKGFALRGLDANGRSYTPKDWLTAGEAYLSELKLDTKHLTAGGSLAVAGNTVRQTAEDVAALAKKATAPLFEPWPTEWKVALGVAAGLAGLTLTVVLVAEVRPLLGGR